MFVLIALTLLATTPPSGPAAAPDPRGAELDALHPVTGPGRETTLHLADGQEWHGHVLATSAHRVLFRKDSGEQVLIARDVITGEARSPGAHGSGSPRPVNRTLISTEPLELQFLADFSLELEHAFANAFTFYFGGQASPVLEGAGAGLGARYYVDGQALRGLYLDLHADFFSAKTVVLRTDYEKAGVGALVGMNHPMGDHFLFSWGVGGEIAQVTADDVGFAATDGCNSSGEYCTPYIGPTVHHHDGAELVPQLRVAFGYAF